MHRSFLHGHKLHRLINNRSGLPLGRKWPCRSSQITSLPLKASRHKTTGVGDDETGHIETGPNEAVLFFDNVFPLRLRWLFHLPSFGEDGQERVLRVTGAADSLTNLLKNALSSDSSVSVSAVVPRLKEGGAFVRFNLAGDKTEAERKVREYLNENKVRPFPNPLSYLQARLVRGRPWVEDLYRPPTRRLKVEFIPQSEKESVEISQEQLYSIFRPYGKIRDIISQPADSKILPKYAYIDFAAIRKCITAKNCLHGIEIVNENSSSGLVKLKIGFERTARTSWMKDWLFNHPRIAIPLLAALGTVIVVGIFDPIRTFYIKTHIQHVFHLPDNKFYKWIMSRASNLLSRRQEESDPGAEAIWEDRQENINEIERWLMESADTFIVVQGPRGSGKRDLVVDMALKNRKDKLVIDCKPLMEARGESAIINAAAKQVGYRPVFSWMNSISGLIDLAAQGAAGIKTGFSETLDGQLSKILINTASALRKIGLETRKKGDKDADTSDDAYLEAHPEKRPVVVLENFLVKSQENSVIYDKLAEWAANITTANVAHVIFLTTDVSFAKVLGKALPDRVFRQLSLGDCSPDVAKRFVVSHLDADADIPTKPITKQDGSEEKQQLSASQRRTDLSQLDESVSLLGGRLTDLEFLARRMKAGETPNKAVEEIIQQSASEILKMYIFDNGSVSDSSKRPWTSEQAWVLIKGLASAASSGHEPALRYNEIVLSSAFSGPNADGVLQSLEQAELIATTAANGRPKSVIPGKPVYLHAFQRLTEDRVLASRLDLAIVNDQMKSEAASIEKNENELKLLGGLPKQPQELADRVQYLLQKIAKSHENITELEQKAGNLKKTLSTDF